MWGKIPEYSWWWITAQHIETKEKKTHLVKFHGPQPLKDELEYYCPNELCVITKMSPSRVSKEQANPKKLHKRMLAFIGKTNAQRFKNKTENRLAGTY